MLQLGGHFLAAIVVAFAASAAAAVVAASLLSLLLLFMSFVMFVQIFLCKRQQRQTKLKARPGLAGLDRLCFGPSETELIGRQLRQTTSLLRRLARFLGTDVLTAGVPSTRLGYFPIRVWTGETNRRGASQSNYICGQTRTAL